MDKIADTIAPAVNAYAIKIYVEAFSEPILVLVLCGVLFMCWRWTVKYVNEDTRNDKEGQTDAD